VSEYQYYEFLALDRPLTAAEQAEVRRLSTRARITATSFTNEYHWGDFRGSPDELMRRYYDAHLYFANWARTGLCSGCRARSWTRGLPDSTAPTRRSACPPPAIT
jgi:hypothetical protein